MGVPGVKKGPGNAGPLSRQMARSVLEIALEAQEAGGLVVR